MKKLSIYFLIIMCLFITGCNSNKSKEVITLDDFNLTTSGEGFYLTSNIGEYNGVSYITGSMVATLDDLEIEMVTYSDNTYPEKVLEEQIDSFNLLKATAAFENNEKGKNYHKYVLVSNNKYMVSSRVENTLIFTKANLDDKELVDKIFDSLGY